jgi:hypothetical protein
VESPVPDHLEEALATAQYISELATADPERLAAVFATVDGRVYGAGDTDVELTIRSIFKPFTYALALADRGFDAVLAEVGVEQSGEAFDELSLERSGRPLNPMINAGAITAHSLVGPAGLGPDELTRRVVDGLPPWTRTGPASGARRCSGASRPDMGLHLMEVPPSARAAVRSNHVIGSGRAATRVLQLQGGIRFAGAERVVREAVDTAPRGGAGGPGPHDGGLLAVALLPVLVGLDESTYRETALLDGAFDTAALLAAAVFVVAGAISLLFLRADTTVEAHTEAREAGTRTDVAEVIPTARR